MGIKRIETAVGPRWVVRRTVRGVDMKKSCKTLVEAERLDAEWAAMIAPSKPRVSRNAQEIVYRFLCSTWVKA